MKSLKKKLNKKDKGILTKLGIRKTRKLFKLSTKMYNICCNKCKKQIMRHPRNVEVKDFCDKCRDKIKPIAEKINKLKNG